MQLIMGKRFLTNQIPSNEIIVFILQGIFVSEDLVLF